MILHSMMLYAIVVALFFCAVSYGQNSATCTPCSCNCPSFSSQPTKNWSFTGGMLASSQPGSVSDLSSSFISLDTATPVTIVSTVSSFVSASSSTDSSVNPTSTATFSSSSSYIDAPFPVSSGSSVPQTSTYNPQTPPSLPLSTFIATSSILTGTSYVSSIGTIASTYTPLPFSSTTDLETSFRGLRGGVGPTSITLPASLTNTADPPLITSTVTNAPPDLSLLLITNSEWTTNTWLTTSRPGDQSSTIVPVLVGCSGCGSGAIAIFNLPEVPNVSYRLPEFPSLPNFHLPCIKLFGIKISGDCNSRPQIESGDDDDGSDNGQSQQDNETPKVDAPKTDEQKTDESFSQSTTATSTSTDVTLSSLSSSSSSSTSSTGSACTFHSTGGPWDTAVVESSMLLDLAAPEYASMYYQYSLQGWFRPPITALSSIATSNSFIAVPGSVHSTTVSSTIIRTSVLETAISSQSTTFQTSIIPPGSIVTPVASLPTSRSSIGIYQPLPRLSSKQCWDSTLINCRYVHNPASICPTTTEALPESCTKLLTTPCSTPFTTTSVSQNPSTFETFPFIFLFLFFYNMFVW